MGKLVGSTCGGRLRARKTPGRKRARPARGVRAPACAQGASGRMSVMLGVMMLVAGAAPGVSAGNCASTRLQVLGSGGPELDDGRASSAYLLWQDGKARLLLDAGSGSSVAFGATGARFADLDAILLTHLHTDHAADLPAFIKGSFFTPRGRDLVVAGPSANDRMPATSTFLDKLLGPDGAFRYLSTYLDAGREAYTVRPRDMPARSRGRLRGEGWRAESLPVAHGPIAAVAWRIEIDGCVVVYAGDMSAEPEGFQAFAQDADLLLLHSAIPESANPVARRLHLTPGELVSIANRIGPRRVLLSHFMKRSVEGAAEAFEGLDAPFTLAEDGQVSGLD